MGSAPSSAVARCVGATTLLLMLASSCGGTGPQPVRLAAVAAQTASAGTARVSVRFGFSSQGTAFGAAGVFDFIHDSGLIELGAGATTVTGDDPNHPSPSEIVLAGGASYSAVTPNLVVGAPQAFKNRRWLLLSNATRGILSGSLSQGEEAVLPIFGLFLGQGFLDPSTYFATMLKLSSSTRVVGHDLIHGSLATHLVLTINPNLGLVAPLVTTTTGGELTPQDLNKFFSAIGGSTHKVDVWVDTQNRLVQIILDAVLPASAQLPSVTVHQEVDYWDFGVRVQIRVPPSDQVATLAELNGAGH